MVAMTNRQVPGRYQVNQEKQFDYSYQSHAILIYSIRVYCSSSLPQWWLLSLSLAYAADLEGLTCGVRILPASNDLSQVTLWPKSPDELHSTSTQYECPKQCQLSHYRCTNGLLRRRPVELLCHLGTQTEYHWAVLIQHTSTLHGQPEHHMGYFPRLQSISRRQHLSNHPPRD